MTTLPNSGLIRGRRVTRSVDPRDVAEKVLRGNQSHRAELLRNMLLGHGFVPVNRRGSHEKFEHSLLDEPFVFVHPHKGNGLGDQKEAAKVCLRVREVFARSFSEAADTPPDEATLPETFQQNGKKDARKKAMDIIAEDSETFARVTPIEQDGYIILRHREIPQIGIAVKAINFPSRLVSVTEQIERQAENFKTMRDLMIEDGYEINISVDAEDGTMTVTQQPYDISVELAPYDPVAPVFTMTGLLEEIQRHIDQNDLVCKTRFKEMLEVARRNKHAKETINADGTTSVSIKLIHPHDYDNRLSVETTLSPHGRISLSEYYRVHQAKFDHDFLGPKGDRSRYISEFMKAHYGFEVTRPGGRRHGLLLRLTHPYIDDFETHIPVPDEVGNIHRIFKRIERTNDPAEQEQIVKQALMFFQDEDDIHVGIREAVRAYGAYSKDVTARQTRANDALQASGFYVTGDSDVEFGSEFILTIRHRLLEEPLRARALNLKGVPEILHLSDLEKLEETISHVQERIKDLQAKRSTTAPPFDGRSPLQINRAAGLDTHGPS